ncbi:MAG: class I SAM-dependent methyltransferase, partial [Actinomycetes bacterium]
MSEHAANRHEAHHPESHLATHDGGTSLADGPAAEGTAAGAATNVAAAAVWDERYRAKPQVWSGKPNPQLVR